MKRLLRAIVLLIILVIVLGLVVTHFLMGALLKKGVERAGPAITKVDVRLDDASLSVLSGTGELKGLTVANPEGYKSPSAIHVGDMKVAIVPRSVFSDKVIIHSINVLAPEITFEGSLQGNNLSKLLDNIRGTSSASKGSTPGQSSSASRKIQVDDLLVTGGKINLSVNLLGNQSAAVPLPDIHLTALGQGPEGITAAELSELLLRNLLQAATKAMAGDLGSLGKVLGGGASGVSTGTVQQIEKATKGLGDLLKRK
jgi:uncharacterized protein involved in outer membrane biogenesis